MVPFMTGETWAFTGLYLPSFPPPTFPSLCSLLPPPSLPCPSSLLLTQPHSPRFVSSGVSHSMHIVYHAGAQLLIRLPRPPDPPSFLRSLTRVFAHYTSGSGETLVLTSSILNVGKRVANLRCEVSRVASSFHLPLPRSSRSRPIARSALAHSHSLRSRLAGVRRSPRSASNPPARSSPPASTPRWTSSRVEGTRRGRWG